MEVFLVPCRLNLHLLPPRSLGVRGAGATRRPIGRKESWMSRCVRLGYACRIDFSPRAIRLPAVVVGLRLWVRCFPAYRQLSEANLPGGCCDLVNTNEPTNATGTSDIVLRIHFRIKAGRADYFCEVQIKRRVLRFGNRACLGEFLALRMTFLFVCVAFAC